MQRKSSPTDDGSQTHKGNLPFTIITCFESEHSMAIFKGEIDLMMEAIRAKAVQSFHWANVY